MSIVEVEPSKLLVHPLMVGTCTIAKIATKRLLFVVVVLGFVRRKGPGG